MSTHFIFLLRFWLTFAELKLSNDIIKLKSLSQLITSCTSALASRSKNCGLEIISLCRISMPHWPQQAPLELVVLGKFTRRFSASSFIDSFVQRSVRLFRFSAQPRHNNLFCNCSGFFLRRLCVPGARHGV